MTKTNKADEVVTLDRRRGNRRDEPAKKTDSQANAVKAAGERRKKSRRRQIDPTTCERDYTGDEVEFMNALDAYKRRAGRMFPTCSEVLEVIRDLGYVKPKVETNASACTKDCDEEDRSDCVECNLEEMLDETDDEASFFADEDED